MQTLKKHLSNVHKHSNTKYECMQCSSSFTRLDNFKIHARTFHYGSPDAHYRIIKTNMLPIQVWKKADLRSLKTVPVQVVVVVVYKVPVD